MVAPTLMRYGEVHAATACPDYATGQHEPELQRVQGELLDRELEMRKFVVAETEHIISLFESVAPLFETKCEALGSYAVELRGMRRRLDEMRENEGRAPTAAVELVPDAANEEATLLRDNARKVAANHSYFTLFVLYQVLLDNLHRVLVKVTQIDRSLTAPLNPVLHALGASWRKVCPLGAVLSVRRVTFGDTQPPPDNVRQAWIVWKELLRRNPTHTYLHSLIPHGSRPGRTRIVFITVGGLGDALLQTPCVAELKRRFHPCEILFIHSRPVVNPLFARNFSVDATVYADEQFILKIPEATKLLGIFDLTFESRFVIWGQLCHGTRLTSAGDVDWIAQTQKAAVKFSPYLERFPHYSNVFARLVRPKMILDVHGMSTGLPVTVESPLVICPDEGDVGCIDQLGLVENSYVTVHDGFDESFGRQAKIARCTKQLPVDKWRALIDGIRREGLLVVQVGAANESPLPGVDVDLRGKTSISQLCFILKGAVVHVDTEGGIVHMARAVHKRSIVFFGPTSVSFWGYPQNINLCSDEYADHWWVNSDWMARSPIAQARSAMEAFDVSGIPALVVREREGAVAPTYELEALSCESDLSRADSPLSSGVNNEIVLKALHRHATSANARIAVIGACPDWLSAAFCGVAMVDQFSIAENQSPVPLERRNIRFGCIYNLSANSESYDVVICLDAITRALHPRRALLELLRLLVPGGALVCGVTSPNSCQDRSSVPSPSVWDVLGQVLSHVNGVVDGVEAARSVPETAPGVIVIARSSL